MSNKPNRLESGNYFSDFAHILASHDFANFQPFRLCGELLIWCPLDFSSDCIGLLAQTIESGHVFDSTTSRMSKSCVAAPLPTMILESMEI